MKKKLFTLLTLLLCLCSGAWGQSSFATGFEENSTTSYNKGTCDAIAISNDAPRTGIYCLTTTYNGTGEKYAQMKTFTMANNEYLHIIAYAKLLSTDETAESSSTQARINAKVGGSNGNGTAVNLTTTWEKITSKKKATADDTEGLVYLQRKHASKGAVLFDDVIAYLSTNSTTDETAPSAATSASATESTISWTCGTDENTGIQNTLIFKRTSGYDDDLTLNHQGIYSLSATEGASTDQSGHWTLVTASIAAAATSYEASLDPGTRYAIVHRDLAYNYSAPTYVTTPSAKTTPVLSLTSTSGSKDIATGRTFNFSTLATLSSSPVDTDITDNIKYSSSDPTVASIDQSTGAITLKKVGETTITASFAGDENYNEASKDYTLTVTSSTDFTADLRNKSEGSYGIKADGTDTTVDDPEAVIKLTATGYNGNQHGWNPGTEIVVPVTGPTKITVGTCQYGTGTVTVKNLSDVTVLSFNTNDGTCYHNNTTDNIVTRYYDGDATTLTITVDNYLPYIAVQAIGEDAIKYTVSFDISAASASATSTVPAAVTLSKGSNYTIPANYTVYKEGKTLTGWTPNAGVTTYNIGDVIENITNDITLTPVFDNNAEETLADLMAINTADVEATWNMGSSSGYIMNLSSGVANYVIHPTVNSNTVDVPMVMTIGSGKIDNSYSGRENNAQVNAGTTYTVPVVDGSVVTLNTEIAQSATTINGITTYSKTNSDKTGTYTYSGSTGTIDIVIGENTYVSSIAVTFPSRLLSTPTISPDSFIADNQEITITGDEGCTFYYTLDGTDPTESSDVYDGDDKPTISSTTTFKAIAVKSGYITSDVASVKVKRTVPLVTKTWDFTQELSSTDLTNITADDTNWQLNDIGTRYSNKTSMKGAIKANGTNLELLDGILLYKGDGTSNNIAAGSLRINHGDYIQINGDGTYVINALANGDKVTVTYCSANTSDNSERSWSVKSGNATQTSADGTQTINGLVDNTPKTVEYTMSAAGNLRIYANNGLNVKKISLTSNIETVPVTPAYEKSTYVTSDKLDFTKVDGITAYVATSKSGTDKVVMTPVNAAVPSGTALLLVKTSGTTFNVPVATSATAPTTNYLKAGPYTFLGTEEDKYFLSTDGKFHWASAGTLPAGKAYLDLEGVSASRVLTISFSDDETTGIEAVNVNTESNHAAREYYNLNGQRVANPTKGLYIVNGKKVIIK